MGNLVYRSTKGSALTYGEMDGNLLELDNRTKEAWNHLRGNIAIGGANPPTNALYQGLVYLNWYDPDNMNECTASFALPMDYVAGTDIYPHGHIVSQTASVGTVRWGFTITWANPYTPDDTANNRTPRADQIFCTPFTVYKENYKQAWDQNLHREAFVDTPISLPLIQPHAVILIRVFRDATHPNDTYPDPVALVAFGINHKAFGPGASTPE